jgi:hypothetical protein
MRISVLNGDASTRWKPAFPGGKQNARGGQKSVFLGSQAAYSENQVDR